MTKRPEEGKAGVNINKDKYEMIRETILELILTEGDVAFKDLAPRVGERIGEKFDGSISWYVTTVKLDLEARGLIRRVPKQSLQRLQLVEEQGETLEQRRDEF